MAAANKVTLGPEAEAAEAEVGVGTLDTKMGIEVGVGTLGTVSYTHLTLPTKRIV